jgi:NTE family protein
VETKKHPETRPSQNQPKPINLALQGGGAHGAFTWGVLDRLLEDERITIEAISGTSAGAMNAVALADGFQKHGCARAREALLSFWRAASQAACFSPIQRTPLDRLMGNWSLNTSPGYLMMDLLSRLASPYDLNPLNLNPLRDFLAQQIDFDSVRRCGGIKLFISATNVRTGRARIFQTSELSADVVMASACLPDLFQAVEIDGEPYWDGGYMGNPALRPFIYRCATRDVLIVQINPLEAPGTPKRTREIFNRLQDATPNLAARRAARDCQQFLNRSTCEANAACRSLLTSIFFRRAATHDQVSNYHWKHTAGAR